MRTWSPSKADAGVQVPLPLMEIIERVRRHQPVEFVGADIVRWAAVGAILRPGEDGPELLFIKRAEHPGDPWSGHMAFPGGGAEDADTSLLYTAIREVQEELGLDLAQHGEPFGQLNDMQAVARAKTMPVVVRPFLFRVPAQVELTPNEEVAASVWIPLRHFMDPSALSHWPYVMNGVTLKLAAFTYGPYTIWGMTHRMLLGFFDILGLDVPDPPTHT